MFVLRFVFSKAKVSFIKKYAHLLCVLLPFPWYVKLVMSALEVKGNNLAENNVLCLSRALFDKDFEQ